MAILIVDDERAMRTSLCRVLERDHEVIEAGTVDDARQALAERTIDLVLCDIRMSGDSGLELVRVVTRERPDTAVVMVTGVDDPEVAKQAIELGALGYLVKPFTANEVRIAVDAALARRELERARERMQHQQRDLQLLSDRERIGRELHSSVVQRIFVIGLQLEAASALVENPQARRRIQAAVEELDATIREIRAAVFDAGPAHRDPPASIRLSVLELVRRAGDVLGFEPRIIYSGAVDSLVPPEVGREMLGALEEALSNVVRHAAPNSVEVSVSAAEDVRLHVADDGVGLPDGDGGPPPGGGLAELERRALLLGGELVVERRASGGTRLEWRVPLPAGR